MPWRHAGSSRERMGRNWEKFRLRALKRDAWLCQRCLKAQATEVHHLVPRSQGGDDDLSNLMSLCSPCHAVADGRVKERALFDPSGRPIWKD